jgi:hypothetical protein
MMPPQNAVAIVPLRLAFGLAMLRKAAFRRADERFRDSVDYTHNREPCDGDCA